jgi:hypothetical protein
MELAYEHMNNPELIRIEPDKMTVDRVTQVLYFPSTEEKIPLLMGLLRRIDARRTMVFVNTKRVAEVLERTLTANGFVAQAISGDVPQNKRLKMMRDFHNGDIAVLIATDVASRGLHIPDVSQLRPSQRCGRLCPSHRPHRACRRRGRRDQLRLRGIRHLAARYRALHWPSDSTRKHRNRGPCRGDGAASGRLARARTATGSIARRRWRWRPIQRRPLRRSESIRRRRRSFRRRPALVATSTLSTFACGCSEAGGFSGRTGQRSQSQP